MTKTELKKLKIAIKSTETENDTLYIEGKDFSCRWDGNNFKWTAPSGSIITMSAKEVVKYVANGDYITSYCFSYGDSDADED